MYIVQGVQLGGTLNNTEHCTAKHNTLHWVEMYLTNTNINSNRIVVPQRWNHAHMRRNYWSKRSGHYSEGPDSQSCLSIKTNGTETLGLVSSRSRLGLTPILIIGPSGVRALPLAAGINVDGHYKWHFFLLLLSLLLGSLLILIEGVVVGFCYFAWAPK